MFVHAGLCFSLSSILILYLPSSNNHTSMTHITSLNFLLPVSAFLSTSNHLSHYYLFPHYFHFLLSSIYPFLSSGMHLLQTYYICYHSQCSLIFTTLAHSLQSPLCTSTSLSSHCSYFLSHFCLSLQHRIDMSYQDVLSLLFITHYIQLYPHL